MHSKHGLSAPYSEAEITTALKDLRSEKAEGPDGMHPELLINCGPISRRWLSKFYTHIQLSGTLLPEFRKSKIIATVKPGKSNDRPKNYRPISLHHLKCIWMIQLATQENLNKILAPLLFNVYIADLPITYSTKFTYADDLPIITQYKDLDEV